MARTGINTTRWTYDAVGNRKWQLTPIGNTGYAYDAANRMLTAGTTNFTYDKNGNQLTAGPTSYSYDALNRLISATGGNGTSTFTYDGDGNRIGQTTSAGTYNYVNDTAAALPVVVSESGPDGNIAYAYGKGLGPLESSSTGFSYFYHPDALGSVLSLTDATGTVQESYSYDAWGNALSAQGNVGLQNKFRFTGQGLDPATRMYFLRARYYEPSNGRFISEDPIGLLGGLNLWGYTLNNPVNFADPYGLDPLDELKLLRRDGFNEWSAGILDRNIPGMADFVFERQVSAICGLPHVHTDGDFAQKAGQLLSKALRGESIAAPIAPVPDPYLSPLDQLKAGQFNKKRDPMKPWDGSLQLSIKSIVFTGTFRY